MVDAEGGSGTTWRAGGEVKVGEGAGEEVEGLGTGLWLLSLKLARGGRRRTP